MLVTRLITPKSAPLSGVPALPRINHRGDNGPFPRAPDLPARRRCDGRRGGGQDSTVVSAARKSIRPAPLRNVRHTLRPDPPRGDCPPTPAELVEPLPQHPTWECRLCGDPCPCRPARTQLQTTMIPA